jgi:hypothetical protein
VKLFPGKYSDLIEEWLHGVAQESADEGFGDVEAPTGYVSKITLDPEAQEHEAAYLERKVSEWFAPFFLVIENNQGQVFFPHYATAEERDEVYEKLSVAYFAWADSDDSPGES